MEIERLDLTAFGPFSGVSIDLSGPGPRLHMIYGPNEAGKSSSLRAIKQFFRGFPQRSSDDFIHTYDALRIGMRFRDRSGNVLELARRKGAKNTLLGPDGKAVEDADVRLARMLGGVPTEEYLQKFVIDHDELIDGGKAIVGGRGELGTALFSAASGLVRLGEVRKKLDEEADSLFKPRGQKYPINQALAELESYRKEIKEASLKSSEWRDLDESRRAHEARKAEIVAELHAIERERNRLARFREAREPIARRRTVLESLEPLADVPRLSGDFTIRKREAETGLKAAESAAAKARHAIDELTRQHASIEVPGALLDESAAIEEGYHRLGAYERSAFDRVRIEAELARSKADARALLRELGRESALLEDEASLETLRLKASDRAEIHELSNERSALIQARDDAKKALEKHAVKRASAAGKLADLGPPRDPSALRKVVRSVRAMGDLDAKHQEASATLKRDERRAAKNLAALGLWSGTLEEIEVLAVPPEETIDRFQGEFESLAAEVDELNRKLEELDAEARRTTTRLRQLQLAGDVPTEQSLSDARGRRDVLWTEIQQGAERGEPWKNDRAAAFEGSTRLADELSDRLRREADRIAEVAKLLADQSEQGGARAEVVAGVDTARERLESSRSSWSALWASLGISLPFSPREMRVWLRKQADLAAAAQSVREQKENLVLLDGQIAAHRNTLNGAFVAMAEPAGLPGDPSSELLDRADGVIDAITRESSRRERVNKDRDELETEQPMMAERTSAAIAEWERWKSRWSIMMARLGLSGEERPESARAVLERIDLLFDHVARATAHGDELAALERESEQFAKDVLAMKTRIGLAIGDEAEPASLAADFHARLIRARAGQQKREGLAERIQEQGEVLEEAEESAAKHRGQLSALAREARAESIDELPAIEERSRLRVDLERELADLNTQLHRLAANSPLEAFLAEAGRVDPDSLDPRIEQVSAQAVELESERERLDQTIGGERIRLEQMNKGDSRAADMKQQAMDLEARIRSGVEEYARLRLASAVLRAGIERYRKKAQDPVLECASKLFATLTLNAFRGLEIAYNENDEPVLKGSRGGADGPSELVDVAGMSLGTADQLYLSLRLATLESFLDRHEPLPLIVDDILIQFDDARAAATLKVLADLSLRTQVLVFTHHEHLRPLAEAAAAPGAFVYHALPGRAATG